MSQSITLYSFADVDRSGKIRWLAHELGLEVVEERVRPGAHRQPPYTELNPLGQIPTVRFGDQLLVESTATCQVLAESVDAPKLWVGRGEPERSAYLYWLAAFGETCEGRLVEFAVSRAGHLDPAYQQLHEPGLRRKLAVLADTSPVCGASSRSSPSSCRPTATCAATR
jgi:glutathione S-transferase